MKKTDGYKWWRHVTDFFRHIHALNQGGIIVSIYDISLVQFLFCKNTKERMTGWNYSFIIENKPFIEMMAEIAN